MRFFVSPYDAAKRIDRIASHKILRNVDVVVWSELFGQDSYESLSNQLASTFPYTTGQLYSSQFEQNGFESLPKPAESSALLNGGVSVFSRWPILAQTQHLYKEACGLDMFASKGFLVVRLNVSSEIVTVIGSHLQSDDDLCRSGQARHIRTTQLYQLKVFVDKLDTPFVLAGDLNIEHASQEFSDMLAFFSLSPYERQGPPSFDPASNSILLSRYGPEYPTATLDYVLPVGYDDPAWINKVLQAKTEPFMKAKGLEIVDMSDHYPIVGYSIL